MHAFVFVFVFLFVSAALGRTALFWMWHWVRLAFERPRGPRGLLEHVFCKGCKNSHA